jgi:ferredoxin--NADP+ reductase
MKPEPEVNSQVVERWEIARGLVVTRIRPDVPLGAFEPGQFVRLGVKEAATDGEGNGKLVRRAYSIASAPKSTEYVEFLIVKVDEGRLSPSLVAAQVGERLWMEEVAKGKFTLEPILPGRDLVLVATGTGIAPFMSMLRELETRPPWGRVLLLHGVQQVAHLAYREELEAVRERAAWFRYVPIVSRESVAGVLNARPGRVNAVLTLADAEFQDVAGFKLDPANADALLCGNPAMVVEVTEMLKSRGFTKSTHKPATGVIHTERYW